MDEFIYHVVQNHVPVSCNRVATSEILASMMKTSSMQFDLFVSIFRCKAGHWSHCFLQLFSRARSISIELLKPDFLSFPNDWYATTLFTH